MRHIANSKTQYLSLIHRDFNKNTCAIFAQVFFNKVTQKPNKSIYTNKIYQQKPIKILYQYNKKSLR